MKLKTHGTMTVLLLLTVLVDFSEATGLIKTAYFSTYGGSSNRRPGGTDLGAMTLFQCSTACTGDMSCAAYQFQKTPGSSQGTCFSFPDLTHNGDMIQESGYQYYEKRDCPTNILSDAVVMTVGGKLYMLYDTEVLFYTPGSGGVMAGSGRIPIGAAFISMTGRITAAFRGPTDNIIYLLKDNQEYCFYELFTDLYALCDASKPTNVLQDFLAGHSDPIDAMVTVDTNNHDLHVLSGATVYKLQWNSTTKKFQLVSSFARNDPSEIWEGMPAGINGMARLTSTTYLLTENTKFYSYSSTSKKVTFIQTLCDPVHG